MDPLRLNPLGGTAVSAPTESLVIPRVAPGAAVGPLFQALGAASPARAQEALGSEGVQGLTNRLLGVLAAPPATTVPAVPTVVAPPPTASAQAAATPIVPSLAAAATPLPQTVPPDSATSTFALETALRFGAGVAPGAGPVDLRPDLTPGPIRDVAPVPRVPALQPKPGGPGPEAYAQPLLAAHETRNAYRTPGRAEPAHGLDLLA